MRAGVVFVLASLWAAMGLSCAADAATITLFGPGVMYIAMENPTSETSVASMPTEHHALSFSSRSRGASVDCTRHAAT